MKEKYRKIYKGILLLNMSLATNDEMISYSYFVNDTLTLWADIAAFTASLGKLVIPGGGMLTPIRTDSEILKGVASEL